MSTKFLLIGVGIVIGGLLLWANVLEKNSSGGRGQANIGAAFSDGAGVELNLATLGGGTITVED